jgi:signal transduction histidine kinase
MTITRGQLAAGLILAAGAGVLLAALLWIGRTTLRLEKAQADAVRLAAQEEKARLALWRLDSALTVVLGRENARPAERSTRVVAPAPSPPPAPPETVSPFQSAEDFQSQLNTMEFSQRTRNATQQSAFLGPVTEPTQPKIKPEPRTRPEPDPVRVETTFQPTWVGQELVLVRRVREGKKTRLERVRIDWPALRTDLLGQVQDLLPAADLVPVKAGETIDPGRRLALLPVRLDLGPLPAPPPPPSWSPARITLAAGSGAIALAALAVAVLLFGSLRQSQRRADFVSAVTHELRTPLTTVRMYTEMLAEEMVPPTEQKGYIATLHAEAERLGHLVENVLAYSRLERRAAGAHLETMALEDLLDGMMDRLGARAERDGFQLILQGLEEHAGDRVTADSAAIERILLNWIDNACKYAAEAADRRLEIRPLRQGRFLALRLADHGPGVPKAARRRIFQPFHKSAARAAASAPGIGLGLSLSRRLARSLGGDLRLAPSPESPGAAFDLLLRRAAPER